ncbi:hypothetical protein EUX98_g7386 [Antrodiella citrinella]|uniref:ABM domain-containing protein n=1 Tax=Antrodiella citrinella TaxID=2447956 RepID=A0A4S4MM86_9APHY|nr:hypothetical protein EUX98_g7386 [Antrodiella citrinella]
MSSDSVVEFASWPASEAFKADRTLAHPALTILAGCKGAQKIYYGIQHEDQTTAKLIIIWDSLADHQALIDDKPLYATLGGLLGPVLAGEITLFHVKFAAVESIPAHLEAPITELATATIKDTSKSAELEAEFAKGAAVGLGSSGKVVEHEKQWLLVKGWQSIEEEHEAFRKGVTEATTLLTNLRQLVEPEIAHWQLTAFKV